MANYGNKAALYAFETTPDADFFLAAQATSASATTTVTIFLNSLDRDLNAATIAILPGGTTASVPAGDIIVHGEAWDDTAKDYIDKDVAITLEANQATVELSTVPFRKVTSITFPIQDGAGATYDVGIANTLDHYIPIRGNSEFFLISLRITSDAEPDASEPFIFTLDSGIGPTFDMNLASLDLDTLNVAAYIYDFAVPQMLLGGDVIRITHINDGANVIGVQVLGIWI